MQFDTRDAVLMTAAFLVPGFIWSACLSALVPRRTAATEARFLEFLTLSCINYGLWIWALLLIFTTGFIDAHPYWSATALFVIVFLSPIALGLVTGWASQQRELARLLDRFGFRPVGLPPTAWDYQFSRGIPCWVIVTLIDGSRVYGRFGHDSFAGDDPAQRDIYLEAVYKFDRGWGVGTGGGHRWNPH